MRRSTLAAAGFVLLCGALAGVRAVGDRLPAPKPGELDFQDIPFHLDVKPGEPFLVRPDRWLALPQLRRDFELTADVELAPGAVLDVVVRRVGPRSLQGVMLPFHERFRVLRMSADDKGPPWRAEAEALLGPPGGIGLVSGSRATVEIDANGRQLAARVAGMPWLRIEAADDYGSVAFLARGGVVALHALAIDPVPRPGPLPLWLVGLAAALPAALGGLLLRAATWRLVAAGLLLLLGAEAARAFAFADLPPLAEPGPRAELLALLAAAPLAFALALRGRLVLPGAAAGLAAGAVLAWLAAGEVRERFPAPTELDALFGPAAGDHAISALARRVPGPLAVHVLEPSERRVVLLGGQLLYRRGAAPDEHVEPLLLGELRPTAEDALVVALPTEDGFTAQQWRLFETCYQDYAPAVLVLGVPVDEAVEDESGLPRSSPRVVAEVIDKARSWCAAHDCELVLLAPPGLAPELRAPLREARDDHGLALVEIPEGASPAEFAQRLGVVVKPLLVPP